MIERLAFGNVYTHRKNSVDILDIAIDIRLARVKFPISSLSFYIYIYNRKHVQMIIKLNNYREKWKEYTMMFERKISNRRERYLIVNLRVRGNAKVFEIIRIYQQQ